MKNLKISFKGNTSLVYVSMFKENIIDKINLLKTNEIDCKLMTVEERIDNGFNIIIMKKERKRFLKLCESNVKPCHLKINSDHYPTHDFCFMVD